MFLKTEPGMSICKIKIVFYIYMKHKTNNIYIYWALMNEGYDSLCKTNE